MGKIIFPAPESTATVRVVAEKLEVWDRFVSGVLARLGRQGGTELIERLTALPVRPSRAVRSLGSYVSRGREAVCIRLQYQQELENLRETLLHELAHACDHLTRREAANYRRAHDKRWKTWARSLGVDPRGTGRSEILHEMREGRMKVVAVCQNCGFEFRRLRRFSIGRRRRHMVHPACGNGRVLLL